MRCDRALLPNATLVVDHWHLHPLADAMLTEVRQRVTQHRHGHRGRKTNDVWSYRRLLLRPGASLSTRASAWTTLPAELISDAMENSRSGQKVLVLDCCYSGAFLVGRAAKADPGVHTLERFGGKGRAVLTVSDATQYSFEGEHLTGEGSRSVFTRCVVEGLRTGEADLDNDGDITLGDLYNYVSRPRRQGNATAET